MKTRWIVNDEGESTIHKTKKSAMAEFNRLCTMDYVNKATLEVIRHDIKADTYSKVA